MKIVQEVSLIRCGDYADSRDWKPVMDSKNGFHAALEAAGIEDFRWHDLRHTFASWLVMKGASLRSVADLLGHRSLKMVMRYAHLLPGFLESEVRLLDDPERETKGESADELKNEVSQASEDWLLGLDSNQQPSG